MRSLFLYLNFMNKNILKELNYSYDDRKSDIYKLKLCAKIYKEKLLGRRFLVIFDNCNYFEVLFTKSEFKHLTGISSDLGAANFYELCIGKKTKGKKIQYISPEDIYTTIEHPRIFALKKFKVFEDIYKLFSNSSYVLNDISENKRFYKLGLANFYLTLFLDDKNNFENTYIPISLKSESHLKNASDFDSIKFVFEKTNPYLKYSKLLYPNKIEIDFFDKYKYKLNELIDFDSIEY